MKPKTISIITSATLFAACLASSDAKANDESSGANNWELVWADEFETDGSPDTSKWNYDLGGHGWGNKELQHYTGNRPQNARVEKGKLIIEARKETYKGSEYTSARLVTRDRAAWTYGRFEISAKLPDGLGTWPAIWMLPSDWNFGTGKWPSVGEIDIMEHVGYDPGIVHATTHSEAYNWQSGTQKSSKIEVPDASDRFHVYALEWEESEIRAYVDGKHYYTYKNEQNGWESWPFQRDYYLILNLAVGGNWGGAEGLDPNCFPQRMEVDYVRVYQKSAP